MHVNYFTITAIGSVSEKFYQLSILGKGPKSSQLNDPSKKADLVRQRRIGHCLLSFLILYASCPMPYALCLAPMFHGLLSRDREDGRVTWQPQGVGSEAYLNGTSQGSIPEDARNGGHIRGHSR